MDFLLLIVMVLIGLGGSFFSGLLGIGGAIINYPLLLYIPSLFGAAHFTAHEVSSISMFQVFFASLAGVIAFRKKSKKGGTGVVNKQLVFHMGSGILAGSLVGGFVSSMLNGDVINLIYGILAVLAVVLMLVPNRGKQQEKDDLRFNKIIAITAAFVVGIVSGIVGAGGAFILIPIMLTVLKIPTRTTIASSLAIVFISVIGGVIGKMTGGDIPLWATVYTVIGSLIGAPIGTMVSSKINVKVLRYGLVVLIVLTAIKVWSSIL